MSQYMKIIAVFKLIVLCLISVLALNTEAAWFTARGQAIIMDGNIDQARQQATREAIKQALLFAGASVRSVQQMTNGLLMSEQLEVRSTGEVSSIELIDEIIEDGVLTVSVRADIFAQKNQCSAADYTKKIATTFFPIRFEGQAATGRIQQLGEQLAYRMQQSINVLTPSMQVAHIEPYVFDWHQADVAKHAKSLANQSNTQYVMYLVIDDISIDVQKSGALAFYKADKYLRSFNFSVHLINGATGESLYQKSYRSKAPWPFALNETVDVHSSDFWHSAYGENVQQMLQTSITDLEEFAICQPTMGRVLAVANNQLQINLGRTHQVQAGDQLTLFNVKQVYDSFGQEYRQFILHPTTLVVRQVFNDTATVSAANGGFLGEVQPNDFVARQ